MILAKTVLAVFKPIEDAKNRFLIEESKLKFLPAWRWERYGTREIDDFGSSVVLNGDVITRPYPGCFGDIEIREDRADMRVISRHR